jgi:hypothetical protein
LQRPDFFLASQPTGLSRSCSEPPRHVLGCWTRCPCDLGFLYQRFSSLLRDEACPFIRSETSKENAVNVATIVLSGTRGP